LNISMIIHTKITIKLIKSYLFHCSLNMKWWYASYWPGSNLLRTPIKNHVNIAVFTAVKMNIELITPWLISAYKLCWKVNINRYSPATKMTAFSQTRNAKWVLYRSYSRSRILKSTKKFMMDLLLWTSQ
jgi:hypothetical protein